MHDQFLVGGDKEFFDYKKIDENDDFDDLKVLEQDEEEKYFDSE